MQEVNEECFSSEEFLLSKVEVTQADIQYRGMVFTSKILCELFELITGGSVEDIEANPSKLTDEKIANIEPEKALYHIVTMLEAVSEKGQSLSRLLTTECSH